jgi:hypothetical protein
VLYLVYGAFCIWGFLTWVRVHRKAEAATADAAEELTV